MDKRGESASARRNLVFGPATLTTGCRPMVFVTTPAQPASNARRMFDSDSVGGADDSRNGFSNRMPVNIVEVPGAIWGVSRASVLRSTDGSFNHTKRAIGRHEHLVRIVEPERLQIDEE